MRKENVPCKCLSIMIPDFVLFLNNSNSRLSSNTFGRMQIWTKKDKNGEP